MFGFKKRLMNAKIRNFEPLTDNDNTIKRKKDLLTEIKKRINLEKVKKDCEGNLFSLRVIYYLKELSIILTKIQLMKENTKKTWIT